MTRTPVAGLLDPIKELVQADIFIDSDDQLAFGHDLIREAVRASSPVPGPRTGGWATTRRATVPGTRALSTRVPGTACCSPTRRR